MALSKTFFRNVVWNHAGKVFDFGLLFLVRVVIARTLGPANDSLFALFSGFTAVLVLLTALGTDWIVYNYLPGFSSRGERDAVAALLRRTYLLRLCASILCAAVCIPLLGTMSWGPMAHWVALAPFAVWVGIFIVGQNLTMLGTAVFTAMLRTRVVFGVTVATRVVLAIAMALLAFSGALTAGRAIMVFAGAAIISAIAYAIRLRPHAQGPGISLPVKSMAVFGAVLLSNDFVNLVLGRQSDILILSYWFPGDPMVSIYDNAFQIGMVVEQIVTIGLGGVLFSVYARLAAENRAAMASAHHRVLQSVQVAFVPVAAAMVLVAPGVIGALYGARFLPVAELVRLYVLLDVIELGLFGGGANIVLLNTVGRERTVLMNRGAWGAVNLIVNLFLIPRYGAFVALLVSRACSMSATIIEYIFVVRSVGGGYAPRTAMIVFVAAIAAVAVASLVPRDTLGECIVAVLIVAVIVGAVYAWLKPPALRWVRDALRNSRTTSSDIS